MRFAPIGEAGQARLAQSHVLLVGAGALGSHLASSMVRAGVGRLTLVDRDVVEFHNLPRQILYTADDAGAGRPKAIAAADHLRQIGNDTEVIGLIEDFSRLTFDALPRPDLILDGTDNFATRFVLNDLSVSQAIPWVYAGVIGARGTAMVIRSPHTPCLRCLLPEIDVAQGEGETCETAGIIEPAVAMVTAFCAGESLKILTGNEADCATGIFAFDLWHNELAVQMQNAKARPGCRCCGHHEFDALVDVTDDGLRLCGRNAVQVRPRLTAKIDLARLASAVAPAVRDIEHTEHMLRFSADECRFSVFGDGRAILFGTDDLLRARQLYDRYVGG